MSPRPSRSNTARLVRAAVLTSTVIGTLATPRAPARADESNRNLLPIGDREAFMANTGITSASAGAVFYNPGNLARLATPTLAMTGTTLLRFDLTTDALLVIAGEDQPFDASGFLTIPTSIVSTYGAGDWHLATSILVPDAIELAAQLTFEAPFSRGTIVFRERQQDLWIGASAARRIGSRGSLGVSLFGVQRSLAEFQVLNVTNDFGGAVQNTENLDASLIGATAVIGGHWQATEQVGVGVRVQTPLVELAGSASDYRSSLTAAGEEVTFVEMSATDLDFDQPLPWDVGVGVSVRAMPGVEVVADVNLQLPESFRRLPDRDVTVLEAAVRASIGADIALPATLRAQVGAMFNGSAQPTPSEQGDSAEDFWGLSGGLSWQSGRTRTGVGLFFQQSVGTLIPSGGDGRAASVRTRLLGALFNVDYSL